MAELSLDDSILLTVRTMVDIPADYDVFDTKLLLYINATMMTLDDLGIGPEGGFFVSDSDVKWSAFITQDLLEHFGAVQAYLGARVGMLFDPPQTAHLLTAREKMLEQMEWRLTNRRPPIPPDPVEE